MPREKVNDLTTPGRYTEVNWSRDKHEPGYVQISTHDPALVGVYVHLDADGIDRLIKTLHKAKRQAFRPADLTDAVRTHLAAGQIIGIEEARQRG